MSTRPRFPFPTLLQQAKMRSIKGDYNIRTGGRSREDDGRKSPSMDRRGGALSPYLQHKRHPWRSVSPKPRTPPPPEANLVGKQETADADVEGEVFVLKSKPVRMNLFASCSTSPWSFPHSTTTSRPWQEDGAQHKGIEEAQYKKSIAIQNEGEGEEDVQSSIFRMLQVLQRSVSRVEQSVQQLRSNVSRLDWKAEGFLQNNPPTNLKATVVAATPSSIHLIRRKDQGVQAQEGNLYPTVTASNNPLVSILTPTAPKPSVHHHQDGNASVVPQDASSPTLQNNNYSRSPNTVACQQTTSPLYCLSSPTLSASTTSSSSREASATSIPPDHVGNENGALHDNNTNTLWSHSYPAFNPVTSSNHHPASAHSSGLDGFARAQSAPPSSIRGTSLQHKTAALLTSNTTSSSAESQTQCATQSHAIPQYKMVNPACGKTQQATDGTKGSIKSSKGRTNSPSSCSLASETATSREAVTSGPKKMQRKASLDCYNPRYYPNGSPPRRSPSSQTGSPQDHLLEQYLGESNAVPVKPWSKRGEDGSKPVEISPVLHEALIRFFLDKKQPSKVKLVPHILEAVRNDCSRLRVSLSLRYHMSENSLRAEYGI